MPNVLLSSLGRRDTMPHWRRTTNSLAAALIVVFISAATAEEQDCSTDEVIEHLLMFVSEAKSCRFGRNGNQWDSLTASKHMRKKYDRRKPGGKYADDPDKAISTPEQFIDRAASRSSTTGDQYIVRCEGQEEESSSVWLTRELQRYFNSC